MSRKKDRRGRQSARHRRAPSVDGIHLNATQRHGRATPDSAVVVASKSIGAHTLPRSGDAVASRLTDRRVFGVLVACGIAAYGRGLFNPFVGDDNGQIVNNPLVHSIANVGTFFQGSTFYTSDANHPLAGAYYRPLQTAFFSLLYGLFGPAPFAFHAIQLAIGIGSSFLVYQVLRNWFQLQTALVCALVLMLHPLDSTVLLFIAAMSDALFFFFGILAFWLLVRFEGTRILAASAGCLFLSLLAKETGVLFVVLACTYLLIFDRRRAYRFAALVTVPVATWLFLRSNAIGFNISNDAPIAALSLGGRLMTMPSVMAFYLEKLVWPVPLASSYYWVHPDFALTDFVWPLLVDLAVMAGGVYVGALIRSRSRFHFRSYVFFAMWCLLGLAAHSQVIPLDMTASNQWFYFSMPGLIGMIATAFLALGPPSWLLDRRIPASVIIVALILGGLRIELRAGEVSSDYSIARGDIQASPDNFQAYMNVANELGREGDFRGSKAAAEQSIRIFPYFQAYDVLGDTDWELGDYGGAVNAYRNAALFGDYAPDLKKAALAMIWAGDPADNAAFIWSAIQRHSDDVTLWTVLAVLQYRHGDAIDGKTSISRAYALDQSPGTTALYTAITHGSPLPEMARQP